MDQADLDPDPLVQVQRWVEAARRAGEALPEAMALATATAAGEPAARMVLLRGIGSGLVFFTDYESDKGRQLEDNPRAAAVLHWLLPAHRQVRASGAVQRVSEAESDRYWATRPVGARASAAASHQSRPVASRTALEESVARLRREHPEDAVPRPGRWGGYRLIPALVEFWEEGPDRLHDRIRYRRDRAGWQIERLSP